MPELAALLARLGLPVAGVGDGVGDGAETHQLVAGFGGDTPDTPRPAVLRIASSPDTEMRMLLVDVTYPFTAPAPDDARLAGALLAPYYALGHTEVDEDGSVHHRYATVLDGAGDLPAVALTHVVSLLDYEQLHYGDYLRAVCERGFRLDAFAELVAAGESGPSAGLV